MARRIKRNKHYVFDKWYLTCPDCGEKLMVKSAHNMSWVSCPKCLWQGKHLFTPKEAVNRFLKEHPDLRVDIRPANLSESVAAEAKVEREETEYHNPVLINEKVIEEENKQAMRELGALINNTYS